MEPDEIEMAKLYWEEFKYRHEHYWKSFFKFSYAIIFLLVIPYLHPDEIIQVAPYIKWFPAAGALLSIAAAWLLAAEYERLVVTYKKLNEIKSKKYKPIKFKLTCFKKVLGVRIGIVVTLIFLFGFLALSVADFLILSNWTVHEEAIHCFSKHPILIPDCCCTQDVINAR